MFFMQCKYFAVETKSSHNIVTIIGKWFIANFIEETRFLKTEQKLDRLDRHVDAEAQVKHERMDNNAKE